MSTDLKGLRNWTAALLAINMITVLVMIVMDVEPGLIVLTSAGLFLVMNVGSIVALVKAVLKERKAGSKHGSASGTAGRKDMSKYIGYIKTWTAFFLLTLIITIATMPVLDVEIGVVMIVVTSLFGVWILGSFGICFFGMKKTQKDTRVTPGQ